MGPSGWSSQRSIRYQEETTVKTKHLFTVTAAIEAGAGLSLLLSPAVPVSLLLGLPLDTPAGLAVGRVGGAALLCVGAACWLARNDEQSRAATGLIAAMLLYNTAAVAVLAHAGMSLGAFGVALWLAVLLHLALAVWCIACLRRKRINFVDECSPPVQSNGGAARPETGTAKEKVMSAAHRGIALSGPI